MRRRSVKSKEWTWKSNTCDLDKNRNIIPDNVKTVKREQKKEAQCPAIIPILLSCILISVATVVTSTKRHNGRYHIPSKDGKRWTVTYEKFNSSSMFSSYSKFQQAQEACQPLLEWQDKSFPTCNAFHEIDMADENVEFVNKGYIRGIWRIDSEREDFVLKTTLYGGGYGRYDLEGQAKDAMISDQLKMSDNVANIYGHCGVSGFYDYASQGNLEDNYLTLNKMERMNVAVDITKALVDLHGLGRMGQSAVIHNDIAIRQFIMLDGRYKLNDFNTARYLRWNPEKHAVCPVIEPPFVDKNRSPEEMTNEISIFDEKIDIYSLGNIFYKLITDKDKYEDFHTEESKSLIMKGDIPDVMVKHEVDLILQRAMIMCLQYDREKRASAKQTYIYLVSELEKMKKKM